MHPSDSVDLSAMFDELKQDLEEEVVAGDGDPETHYNLGVAFREMGLLDEAIAEFQKVCTAIDRGHAFSQTVQTYTWLAQCFLDKEFPNPPSTGMKSRCVSPDSMRRPHGHQLRVGIGLRKRQDRPAALRHFTNVLQRQYRLSRRGRAHSGSKVVECTKWVRLLRRDATRSRAHPTVYSRPY